MNEQLLRRQKLDTPIGRLERIVEIRLVEESIQKLFNDGHVRGSTHLAIGQEAVSIGIASAIRPTDIVTCTYRGHATALALGVTPDEVLGEICGREIGCAQGLGGSMHLSGPKVGLMPTFAIVGAGLPVAAGAALSAQVLGKDDIALAICGDGATNIGAFHETLNFASIWKLPIIFVVENNLYGEYSRINLTTPIDDLAIRGSSYAMISEIVDGQDVDAMHDVIVRAAARARKGDGPTLIEAKTYRFSGHSRSDPATYRVPGELDLWKKRDPLILYKEKLIDQGLLNEAAFAKMETEVAQRLEETLARVLSSPEPGLMEIFRHITAGEM